MSVYNGKVKFKHNKLHLLLAYALTKIGLLGYMILTHNLSLWWLLIVSGVIGLIIYSELLYAEYRSHSTLNDDELKVILVRWFGMIKILRSFTVDRRIHEVLEFEVKNNSEFTLDNIHKTLNVQLVFINQNKAG